jgi:DNA-binding response OmpR family regulator
MMTKHILVVEDDENLRLTLSDFLEDEYQVSTVDTLAEAKALLRETNVNLIILDIMLPDGDGYGFCSWLREYDDKTPVLMLTARSLEDDLVKGFDVGADDYLVKPYRSSELLSRIRALLKRATSAQKNSSDTVQFSVNGFVVNRQARVIKNSMGHNIELTPKELELLFFLWDNPHRAISRDELLEQVWGNTVIDERTVDNFISSIKKKLLLSVGSSVFIETVRGIGYRLEKPL